MNLGGKTSLSRATSGTDRSMASSEFSDTGKA